MTTNTSEGVMSDIIKKWKQRADDIENEYRNGHGDLYREFRRCELEILRQCIEDLQSDCGEVGKSNSEINNE